MLAILCRPPQAGGWGMSKQNFMRLTDWDLVNWLGRPGTFANDPAQAYWPVPRFDPNDPPTADLSSPRALFFLPARVKAMKTIGMTDEEIEAQFEAWAEEHGWLTR